VALNPGGVGNQIFYGLNSRLTPDGALVAPVDRVFPDRDSGAAGVPLNHGPGVYTVVGRAEGYNVAGDVFTAWSTPVSIRAFAPFDLASLTLPDSRGPSFRLRAAMGEQATSGRVSLAIARGSRGGRYRSLGSISIRGHRISKRFRAARTGTYRIRFSYHGNALVAPGRQIAKLRISRRIAAPDRQFPDAGSTRAVALRASAVGRHKAAGAAPGGRSARGPG
jgi:hypothetical protein